MTMIETIINDVLTWGHVKHVKYLSNAARALAVWYHHNAACCFCRGIPQRIANQIDAISC